MNLAKSHPLRAAAHARNALRGSHALVRIFKPLGRAALLVLWFPAAAFSQTILQAAYDPSTDQLIVQIAYQGTHRKHEFSLAWESCRQTDGGRNTTVARLIDQNGDDIAKTDYRVTRTFGLSGLDCRPADVTIRLGPVSNRTVSIPALSR